MKNKMMPLMLGDDSELSEESKKLLANLYQEEGDGAWEPVAGDDPLDERRLTRNSFTLEELEQQPNKIRETLSEERESIRSVARAISLCPIERIYLIGCGDSLAALRAERFLIEGLLHVPCLVEDPLDFVGYYSSLVDNHTLVVGLSSSGRTIRVVESLLLARARGGMTVAMTNSAGSCLTQVADHTMMIHAARKGWPTQSSTSAMAMVCRLMLDVACERGVPSATKLTWEFENVPDLMLETMALTRRHVCDLADGLINKNAFFFCGSGPLYTCAEYGAAKVKDATPSYAMAVLTEEFHHYNTVKDGNPLFVVAPKGASSYRSLEALFACRQLGGSSIVLTSEDQKTLLEAADDAILLPEMPETFASFAYSVPLQQFGYYLSQAMEKQALRQQAQIR
jgi:glucosamine--fructose-6-phosphate aminotransferase (isomerizing)